MKIRKLSKNQFKDAFRIGVKNACAKSVWESIKNEVKKRIADEGFEGDVSSMMIADRLGLSESQCSRFEDGSMDSKTMFTLITLLEMNWVDIDELPHTDFRAIAGYQQVIYRLRDGHKSAPKHFELISTEILLAVRKLLRIQIKQKVNLGSASDSTWKEILITYFCDEFPGGWSCLRENYLEWGAAVQQCFVDTPFKWSPGRLEYVDETI